VRRYTTNSLLDRMEALEVKVASLEGKVSDMKVREITTDFWPEWTEPVWDGDPWPAYDTYKEKTTWSHSDGGAPWNQNFRTVSVDGITKLAKEYYDPAIKESREYEPDERIRGQFK
jgi:hypothetical protein